MILLIRIDIDDQKATDYNASLFAGDADDPVQGDGKALVCDLVGDGELGRLLRDCEFVTSTAVTLDGEEIPHG